MKIKLDGNEIITPHSEHELRKIFPEAQIEVLTGAGHAEVSQDAAVPEPVREEAAAPEEGGAEAASEEAQV